MGQCTFVLVLLLVYVQLCSYVVEFSLQLLMHLLRKRSFVQLVSNHLLPIHENAEPLYLLYLLDRALLVALCVQSTKNVICDFLWILVVVGFFLLMVIRCHFEFR